jgi:hypothetical protein
MTNETCPGCNAELDADYPSLYYQCGTLIKSPEHQTLKCLKGQLAKQSEKIESLLTALYLADCLLSGANMNLNVVERKVREAILMARPK